MNLGNGFIPWVTWKTTMCGVWIWLFQVFWWTPVNIWDQLRHMALVFVALFFFGAHHPLSRKRREDILDTSETNLELPQQQMPGAWSGNKRCLYPLQGWLCWLVLGDIHILSSWWGVIHFWLQGFVFLVGWRNWFVYSRVLLVVLFIFFLAIWQIEANDPFKIVWDFSLLTQCGIWKGLVRIWTTFLRGQHQRSPTLCKVHAFCFELH